MTALRNGISCVRPAKEILSMGVSLVTRSSGKFHEHPSAGPK